MNGYSGSIVSVVRASRLATRQLRGNIAPVQALWPGS